MTPLLETRQLTKTFGGLVAVKDFSITLNQGDLTGLIGPNGAGKTTVFNLITGMYAPTCGSITFAGREISGLRPYRLYQLGIARTFQNIRLFKNLSVLDNVRVATHYRGQSGLFGSILRTSRFRRDEKETTNRARDLLSILGLERKTTELARSLSYGEQRRLEIARALISNPRLLLLDEPAAGMNPSEVGHLMDLIGFIHDRFRLTILLIEHQMKVVMGICRFVVVMDFGEVICRGKPNEVQCDDRVIEAYLGRSGARDAVAG